MRLVLLSQEQQSVNASAHSRKVVLTTPLLHIILCSVIHVYIYGASSAWTAGNGTPVHDWCSPHMLRRMGTEMLKKEEDADSRIRTKEEEADTRIIAKDP